MKSAESVLGGYLRDYFLAASVASFRFFATGKQKLRGQANRCCQDAKDKPGIGNKLGAQSQILHMNVKEYEGAHHSGNIYPH